MARVLSGSIGVVTLLFHLGVGCAAQSGAPVVDLGYARYQGTVNPTTQNVEFLGIRFAAPPTGPLRWRAPKVPERVDGLLIADTQPYRCHWALPGANPRNPIKDPSAWTQSVGPTNSTGPTPTLPPLSEDCLFLNVYAPPLSDGRLLPVVFWIHGGGYVLGSISGTDGISGAYDGNDLIRQAGGQVVVVMIQYRLGVFGFLSSSVVKQDGVLNAGLLDQEFGLKWTQEHVSKFGGDPNKVTIWGESAGAGSVLQHLVANGGNTSPPLFRGAMLSSPYLASQYPFNHEAPETLFQCQECESLIAYLSRCSAAPSPMDCLRASDVATLSAANQQICTSAFFGTFAFFPVIDGSFIRGSPTRALQLGKVNTRKVLAVVNSHEGTNFVDTTWSSPVQEYLGHLFPTLTQHEIDKAASIYGKFASPLEHAIQVMNDALFVCPTYAILNSLKGRGFKGEFAIPPALHGEDLNYYFPSSFANGTPYTNQQFIKAFSQSFLDFVLEQDPNAKHDPTSILPQWPRWSKSSPAEMVFNRTGDLPDLEARPGDSGLLERCKFWQSAHTSFQ